MSIPSTKKIGGVVYDFFNSYWDKGSAKRRAKALKGEGHKARVVNLGEKVPAFGGRTKTLWGVYYRIGGR